MAWEGREALFWLSPQRAFIQSFPHQLWDPWRQEDSRHDVHLREWCLWRMLGIRTHCCAPFCCEHTFRHGTRRQAWYRADFWKANVSCSDSKTLDNPVSRSPWRGYNPQMVLRVLCIPQSLVAEVHPCPHFPTPPIWPVCRADLKCDAHHLCPRVTGLVSATSCHSP